MLPVLTLSDLTTQCGTRYYGPRAHSPTTKLQHSSLLGSVLFLPSRLSSFLHHTEKLVAEVLEFRSCGRFSEHVCDQLLRRYVD